ncbi:hypothetical protein [Gracilibacillus saliphilus]|uniref:hypothetical protein n=1 Tax=Gracilibacillus saliphilus TaxID=543890 RepID=UPI0013D61CEB|nr:hypothetical protein [Gracilibacillus saliphilus]
MKNFYIYHCDAPGCDMDYAVVDTPLSCPYCDSQALTEKPKFVTTEIRYDLYKE